MIFNILTNLFKTRTVPDGVDEIIDCDKSWSHAPITQAVMARVSQSLREGRTPLILKLEEHQSSYLVSLDRSLIKAVLGKVNAPLSVSDEMPYNGIEHFLNIYTQGTLAAYDRRHSNKWGLQYLSSYYMTLSPLLKQQINAEHYKNLQKPRYSFHFADAARNADQYVQYGLDLLTNKSISACYPYKNINFAKKESEAKEMHVRNHASLQVIYNAMATDEKKSSYPAMHIHSAGIDHGFGLVSEKLSFKQSLVGQIIDDKRFNDSDVIVLLPEYKAIASLHRKAKPVADYLPRSVVRSIKNSSGARVHTMLMRNYHDDYLFNLGYSVVGGKKYMNFGDFSCEKAVVEQINAENGLDWIDVDMPTKLTAVQADIGQWQRENTQPGLSLG